MIEALLFRKVSRKRRCLTDGLYCSSPWAIGPRHSPGIPMQGDDGAPWARCIELPVDRHVKTTWPIFA
jgi:hypothetical protein